jgi:PKD repeat protein
VGNVYTFTASVSPLDATQPVTYTFQASDQPPAVVVAGTQAGITYTWETAGVQQILVSAENPGGLFTATHTITVTDLPISGLVASNDSPTRLGSPTTLSASILTGSGVSYTWDFGDGGTGSEAVVTHIYATPGAYTATVTAVNTAGSLQATTPVRIIVPMYLPLVPRN